MEKQANEDGIKSILDENLKCKLPRWEDLPDIDLYMDQVIVLMSKYLEGIETQTDKALTPSMINNYVKMNVLPSPVKKKYSKIHLSHLLIICIMKQILPIHSVSELIKTQLKFKTEEDLLNLFADSYETIFGKVYHGLKDGIKNMENAEEDEHFTLPLLALHATAVSSSGKFIAERIVSDIKQKNDAKNKPKDKIHTKDENNIK